MFFNLFGKEEEKKDHLFKDRAYMTTTGKLNACADLAEKDLSVTFIAWFPETAKLYREFFIKKGLSENRITETKQLHASQLTGRTPVFVEHYPLHTKEEELVKHWDIKNIIVYSALDEPLFKHFGSEKMIPVMKMMGMKETEAVEHALVSKSIITGQHKIAEKVIVEQTAPSQAEWMKRNLSN